jgi:CDP-diacylglycerol--glycerol-3-phosphate 3-phosphatidyltransferase
MTAPAVAGANGSASMLTVHVRTPLSRVLLPVGRALARAGLRPDTLTVVGAIGVVAGALVCYPQGRFFVGTLVITAFVLADLLDGAVARARGGTGSLWGAFLDSTMDRISDAAIFAGLVLWFAGRGDDVLLAAVALFDLVAGVLVSYTKARAEGLGLTCNVGLMERSERLIVVLLATGLDGLGVPYVLAAALWLLAVTTAVTVGQRVAEVRRQAVAAAAAGRTP